MSQNEREQWWSRGTGMMIAPQSMARAMFRAFRWGLVCGMILAFMIVYWYAHH
jgi:hypothetical protein